MLLPGLRAVVDVPELGQEAVGPRDGVLRSCRIGLRHSVIADSGGREEMSESLVDVQGADVPGIPHAVAEALRTGEGSDRVDIALEQQSRRQALAHVLVR